MPAHLDDVHARRGRHCLEGSSGECGHSVLITSIGGGVALGARVYVTSGSDAKIARAIALGAAAGVNYTNSDWPTLKDLLGGESLLDSVIDSAGGPIAQQIVRVLRPGDRIVLYGMTVAPQAQLTIREVLRNQQLVGSTMGSKADLQAATDFIAQHRITPIVSRVLDEPEDSCPWRPLWQDRH